LALENLMVSDNNTQTQLTNHVNTVISDLENLNTLRSNNQFSTTALNQLAYNFNTSVSSANTVSNNQSAAKANILINNHNLSNTATWQANERTLNRVVLENELWNNELTNTTAIAELKAIADQCPLLGGQAVFAARGLYRTIDPAMDWNDDNICALVSPHEGELKNSEPQSGWILFPNPACDYLSIRNDLQKEGQYSITFQNILGVSDKNIRYSFQGNQFDLNTRDWPAGFYTWIITEASGLQYSGKIIISHP
jgi:hypothetical protein